MCATRRAPKKRSSIHRYSDYVKIDESRVPEKFRHLIPYAKYWSIGDDVDRARLMARTSLSQKQELAHAVLPLRDQLRTWCEESYGFAVPVPDEVVLFEMLLEAAAEADLAVHPPAPRPPPPPPLAEPPLTAEQKAELEGYVDILTRPATGDREEDAARAHDAFKSIQLFWARVLAEHSPELSPARIAEYLGFESQPEAAPGPFPSLPAPASKELIKIRDRVRDLLGQCEARSLRGFPAVPEPKPTGPSVPPSGDPGTQPGNSGASGGRPSVS